MHFWRLKRFLVTLTATLVCLGSFMGVRCLNVCRLSALEGARTFYLYTPSSQALCKKSLRLSDVFFVQGECVRFNWEQQGLQNGIKQPLESVAEEIAALYDAEVLFFERASGTLSAYCYSQKFIGGVELNGKLVNLHISLCGKRCAVGTPLIFDGF